MMPQCNLKLLVIESFLRFYSVDEIKYIKIIGKEVYGQAIWRDVANEVNNQDFVWNCLLSKDEMHNLIKMLDYIFHNGFYENDKILISEEDLMLVFNRKWDNATLKKTVKNMFEVEIEMLDEQGQRNDAFYLHM